MNVVALLLLSTTVGWFVFTYFFFWMNAIVDTHFYWAFAHYLRTGMYPFIEPFVYIRPTTVSPPLYSGLLALILKIPRSDILLHTIHIVTFTTTCYFLYKVLRLFVSNSIATVATCLFALIPANTVYLSYTLTEIPSQFAATLFTYLFLTKRWSQALGLALIISLLKFSFLSFAAIALFMFVQKKTVKLSYWLFPAAGVVVLAGWIYLNFTITGIWGISDNRGAHLYNHIVGTGKTLPAENSDSLKKLRTYIPKDVSLYAFYWDLQPYILPHVGQNWVKVDEILGAVAMDAIIQHPFRYAHVTLRHVFELHRGSLPYWKNLSSFGTIDPVNPVFCGSMDSIEFCRPILDIGINHQIWNTYIRLSSVFYERLFGILMFFVFLPVFLYAILQKNRRLRLVAILYILAIAPIAMVEHTDTRYIVPFYPLLTVLVTVSILTATHALSHAFSNHAKILGETSRN